MDFNSFYLKVKDSSTVYKVDLDDNGKIGLNQKKKVQASVTDFEDYFQMKLVNHVNFYSSFCMIGTSFIVAHHNKVFVYHVKDEEVVCFFEFDSPVVKLFRIELSEGVYNVIVLLKNGVKILHNTDSHYLQPSKWEKNEQYEGSLEG